MKTIDEMMRKAKGPAKFDVGHRVHHSRDPYRYGVVTKVTECLGTWMYDVAWDCDEIVYEEHLAAVVR